MKRTLLILVALISINCFGQSNYILNDSTIRGNIIEWPTEEEMQEQYMFESNYQFYLAWEKYSVECYNDSILDVYYDYYKGVILNKRETWDIIDNEYVLIKSEDVYNHKQPTFTGFMEWLKTKYE